MVSGMEIWENVTVLTTGVLTVPIGATLNATNIYLQGDSIVDVDGGSVILFPMTYSSSVRFNGTCSFLNVTNGGTVSMRASNGYADTSSLGPYSAYIPVSMGGDTELNITATLGTTIANASFNLRGGNGFDLPRSMASATSAWRDGVDLAGYTATGGNATFRLGLLSTMNLLSIESATLNITGGQGGKAADGANSTGNAGAKGGGYTNGATVSGYVGKGGSARLLLNSSSTISLIDSQVIVTAGDGGRAGDGGSSGEYGGSGGGGYCGGNGVSFDTVLGSGGEIRGEVGTGGRATVEMLSANSLTFSNTSVGISSGKGGDAGRGGGWNSSWRSVGGRGGGGYGGGGGGGYYGGGRLKGYDGYVYDHVGSAGNISLNLTADVIVINGSTIHVEGGAGGRAGSPGEDATTPGGAGYGGGGGGYYQAVGGSGFAEGSIGVGGSVFASISATQISFSGSSLNITAGEGGDAADGGSVYEGEGTISGSTGSGGGGGYGGGGGARSASGGSGFVSGSVGTGGEARVDIHVSDIILMDGSIQIAGGNGGEAGDGGDTHDAGGAGGGGYGGGGASDANGHGGAFTVQGAVGRGGDSHISLHTESFVLINASVLAEGGKGGDGGVGGIKNHSYVQSAGGGGYGGGGGGNGGAYIGGQGDVLGVVGDGGNSSVTISSSRFTMSRDSDISAVGGMGGNAPTSPGEGDNGGEGEGRVTMQGEAQWNIPMSVPLLVSPSNNSSTTVYPMFSWLALHNAKPNGLLTNYTLQVDDDVGFSSPEINETLAGTEYNATAPLAFGAYYWRVKANYLLPPGSTGGWSEIWRFTVDVSPPGEVEAALVSSSSDLRITWTLIDPETCLDHYEVWRGSVYSPKTEGYTKISPNLPPGTSSWTDVGAGSSPSDYFYFVRAVSTSGSLANSLGQAAKLHKNLVQTGPHLLSTSVVLSSNQIESIFQGTFDWSWARVYNASDLLDPWKAYYKFKTTNDLSIVNRTEGIWVNASSTGDCRMAGRVPCNTTIRLKEGWNLVGYPSMISKTVGAVTASLIGPISVQGYDSLAAPYLLRILQSSDIMNPLEGYWIHSPIEQDWTIVNDPSGNCE